MLNKIRLEFDDDQARSTVQVENIQVRLGLVTKAWAKKLCDELQGLVLGVQSQEIVPRVIEGLGNDDQKLVHRIQVEEESDGLNPS